MYPQKENKQRKLICNFFHSYRYLKISLKEFLKKNHKILFSVHPFICFCKRNSQMLTNSKMNYNLRFSVEIISKYGILNKY